MEQIIKDELEEALPTIQSGEPSDPLAAALNAPVPTIPMVQQPVEVRPAQVAPRSVNIPRSVSQTMVSTFPDEFKTEYTEQEPKEYLGAAEGIGKATATGFKRFGLLSGALTYGLEKQPSLMNGNYKDDKFDPTSDDLVPAYQAIDPRYWPTLLDKRNQAAWDYSYQRILTEQQEDRDTEKTKWWQLGTGYLAGGAAALGVDALASDGLINPVTRIIAGSLAKTIARNAVAGGVEFGLYESAVQLGQYSARETMEIQEALVNVAMSATLGSLTAGAASVFRQKNLNDFKSLLSKQSEGVEVKYNLDKKGNVIGFSAVDDSAGAMKVTNYDYKDFAISGFTEGGQSFSLYMSPVKPIVSGMTKGVAKIIGHPLVGGNPVVQGMLSKSSAMRSFTANMMRPNFEIDAVTLNGKKRPQSLDERIKARTAQVSEFEEIFIQGWFKQLGVEFDGQSFGKLKAQEFMQKSKSGLTYDQFKEEVSRSVSRNGVSDNPAAEFVAKQWVQKMEQIDLELQQFIDLPKEVFGADRHFAREFDTEWMWQNPKEAMENIFQGFKKTQEEIVELTAPIAQKQAEIALIKQRLEFAKDAKSKKAITKQITEQEKQLEAIEAKLVSDAKTGKISRKYTVGKGEKAKIRQVVDEDELRLNAQKTYNRMLGLSQEQMDEAITGGIRPGASADSFLEERVLMFTDEELHNYKLMEPDPVRRINSYLRRAIKFIESEKFFKEKGYVEGKESKLEFMTNKIEDDYDLLRNQKIAEYTSKKEGLTGKKLEKINKQERQYFDKLTKQQKNDVQIATNIYDRVLGPTPEMNKIAQKFFGITGKWMDFAYLNTIAVLQLGELITPAFTKGWSAHMNNALIPYFKEVLIPMAKGNAAARKNARNFGLAIQFMNTFFSRHWDANTNRIPKGWRIPYTDISFESYIDKGGKVIRSLNLSDPISNITETVAVMGTQAAIIQSLEAAAKGTIKGSRKRYLSQLGLDDDAMGKRILKQQEKYGEVEGGTFGRTFANTHLWDDIEAKNTFTTAVFGDVRATQFFGPDTTSWPTWAGDPRGPSRFLFKYMGYSFTAMSNFLLPAMQSLGRADFERMSVIGAIIAINALVDPLRKISRGEEPDLSPESLLAGGIINSGMGGILVDTALRFNNFAHIFDMGVGDRFRYSRSLMNSAPEVMLTDLAKVIGMGLTANPNKADVKRAVKLFAPFLDVPLVRPLETEIIDNLDIPKTNKESVFGD
jgi:hypothetical protein